MHQRYNSYILFARAAALNSSRIRVTFTTVKTFQALLELRGMQAIRKTIAVVLLTLGAAWAQELKLGDVTVRLGMPKTEAVSKLLAAGYIAPDNCEYCFYDSHRAVVYTVLFTNNRLTYAERPWDKEDFPDTTKGATYDALIRLLKVATEGSHNCSIKCRSVADPDISADRVFISCDGGKRNVLIVKGKHLSAAHSMKPGSDWYDIDETIGERTMR